jgi:hypothetical protein
MPRRSHTPSQFDSVDLETVEDRISGRVQPIGRKDFISNASSSFLRDQSGAVQAIGAAPMADNKYLTPEEVAERYRGEISVATLRNWRAARRGPSFTKIGKAVLYDVAELDAWDRKNLVICDPSKPIEHERR